MHDGQPQNRHKDKNKDKQRPAQGQAQIKKDKGVSELWEN
jgi:hypothetical protein